MQALKCAYIAGIVLAEGGSFASGVDVVLLVVLVLASSLEGEVLLHRQGVVSGRRDVCGRRHHRVGSVNSVVPEAHVLAIGLAMLEGTPPVFVHDGVPATRVVVAVVSSTRVVVAVVPSTRVVVAVVPSTRVVA